MNYLIYFVANQLFNAIFKKFFGMVKVIEQNPVFKRNGIANIFLFIINNLQLLA